VPDNLKIPKASERIIAVGCGNRSCHRSLKVRPRIDRAKRGTLKSHKAILQMTPSSFDYASLARL
jgi:hypothetical protein